jgi:hypothetical protein
MDGRAERYVENFTDFESADSLKDYEHERFGLDKWVSNAHLVLVLSVEIFNPLNFAVNAPIPLVHAHDLCFATS